MPRFKQLRERTFVVKDHDEKIRSFPQRLDMRSVRMSRILLFSSLAAYLLCMLLPPYATDHGGQDQPNSIVLLLLGWFGISAGYLEWLANPMLLVAWLSIASYRHLSAVGSALLAMGLSIVFSFRDSVITGELDSLARVTELKAGYWLWVVSAVFALSASVVQASPYIRRVLNLRRNSID